MKTPVLTVVGPAEVTHFYSIEITVLNFFITLLEFILCQCESVCVCMCVSAFMK